MYLQCHNRTRRRYHTTVGIDVNVTLTKISIRPTPKLPQSSTYAQGFPSPQSQWCIPLFHISLFLKIWESGKIFPTFGKFSQLFKKTSHFIRQNFWWPSLVIRSDFVISFHIFAKAVHFPPVSGNVLFPSCFAKFPSDFVELTCS